MNLLTRKRLTDYFVIILLTTLVSLGLYLNKNKVLPSSISSIKSGQKNSSKVLLLNFTKTPFKSSLEQLNYQEVFINTNHWEEGIETLLNKWKPGNKIIITGKNNQIEELESFKTQLSQMNISPIEIVLQ